MPEFPHILFSDHHGIAIWSSASACHHYACSSTTVCQAIYIHALQINDSRRTLKTCGRSHISTAELSHVDSDSAFQHWTDKLESKHFVLHTAAPPLVKISSYWPCSAYSTLPESIWYMTHTWSRDAATTISKWLEWRRSRVASLPGDYPGFFENLVLYRKYIINLLEHHHYRRSNHLKYISVDNRLCSRRRASCSRFVAAIHTHTKHGHYQMLRWFHGAV